MGRSTMRIAAILAALILTLAGGIARMEGEDNMATPYERHGRLHVEGVHLVDESGAPFALRGVSTHGIGVYPEYVNADAFRTLRDDWGANVIRLAMYTEVENGYLTGGDKAAQEALIDRAVNDCADLGLYVIIDWHILTDYDPNQHVDEAVDFFDRMAARYAGCGNVIYEICNEPNGAVNWATVKRYAERVVPVIRRHAPDALILCGTPMWSQDVDSVAAAPLDDANVMYVLHFYAATHRDLLRAKLERALDAGTPVFISEFSICDASGNGRVDYDSAAAWRQLILDRGLSYIGWNLSNKDESSALIQPDCALTSDWPEDAISETGLWLRNCLREDRDRECGR